MSRGVNSTHVDRLLKHLQSHGTITPMEAWSELGIYRLGARVFDLRKAGHNVETEIVPLQNQFGEPCKVARYTLI
jgi:DNA-binding IclR family transcriptional regulator